MASSRIGSLVAALLMVLGAARGVRAESDARGQRVKLAVFELTATGVPAEVVQTLTDVVVVALTELRTFEVLSRQDIVRLLQFEQEQQLLGCASDSACLAEVGGALGVALMVSGGVGKVGPSYIVNLSLTDTKSVVVRAREERQADTVEALTEQVRVATRALVRELLAQEKGFLVLKCSESAAEVEVDDRLVGTTPFPRTSLGGGPHIVRVNKRGFVGWAREIDVRRGEHTVLDVVLVPSPEVIAEYDARAGLWRAVAYAGVGLGVGAVGFAGAGWVWNGSRVDAYEDKLIAANCQRGAQGAPAGDCAPLQNRYDELRRFDLWTQLAGGLGAVAIATGAALFAFGPTPGAYDEYRPADADTARLDIIPAADGVFAVGTWRWQP